MKGNLKLLFKAVAISICFILTLTMVAAAAPLQAATSKQLSTNYALVNLGSEPAEVIAAYYKTDGSTWSTSPESQSFTIDPNYGQKGVAQYFDAAMTPGTGSVVLSSSQPLGAVVQILARAPQVATSGAYSGVTAPSDKFYVPQVSKRQITANGESNSQIIIQNTETSAITVTVEFTPFPGIAGLSPHKLENQSIPAGSSFVYDLTNVPDANLARGWAGSAVVYATDSTKKIAVVVNTFIGAHALQTYNAFPKEILSSGWVIPMFTSRLGNKLSTPITFQNPTSSEIPAGDVLLSCKALDNSFTPTTFEMSNPSAVPGFGAGGFNPVTNMDIPALWSGTCRLISQSSKDMVVLVQMRRPGVSDELAAYEAFPFDSAGTKVVVPAMSKRQPNGFATTATIANLDVNNPALVKLTYTPSANYVQANPSAQPIIIKAEIPAGGSFGQNLRVTSYVPQIPDGWYGTLLIEPDDGATPRPIVAVVQLTNYLNPPGDTSMAHDAIVQ